jgi:CrcB protein
MYSGANWHTTWAVNISGSFLIGVLTASALGADPRLRLLLGSGFLGGYTTFSTWQLEGLLSARQGDTGSAALNLILSVVAGIVAVALGYAAGSRLR